MDSLPAPLTRQIESACRKMGIDSADALEAIPAIMGTDKMLGYSVWTGPGYQQPDVVVDIFVLGKVALYNWTRMANLTASNVTFLDSIDAIQLVSDLEGPSPEALMYTYSDGTGSIFGKKRDHSRLRKFLQEMVRARRQDTPD